MGGLLRVGPCAVTGITSLRRQLWCPGLIEEHLRAIRKPNRLLALLNQLLGNQFRQRVAENGISACGLLVKGANARGSVWKWVSIIDSLGKDHVS